MLYFSPAPAPDRPRPLAAPLPTSTSTAATVSKTRKHHQHACGRFWIAGEHFVQNFTLFCHILQFVVNYALLTSVHMNQEAQDTRHKTQDCFNT